MGFLCFGEDLIVFCCTIILVLDLNGFEKWEDYFEAEKAKAQAIQSEIDRAIDLVCELYGLTEEEIKIEEGS